jgi:hypothetical protein
MSSEEQLRTIAAATQEEQTQVWKKHSPSISARKTERDVAFGPSQRVQGGEIQALAEGQQHP